MTFFELLLLSVGLSMDVFAVSMSNGLTYTGLNIRKKALIIAVFGLFHFGMLCLGFVAGDVFMHLIEKFDHRLALILLLYVGGSMIVDFVKDYKIYKETKGKIEISKKNFTSKILLLQAVAVSIDAIAVGLSISALDINIWTSAICVMVVSMIFCLLGFLVGKKFGLILKHRSQLFGGLILIGIGIKIFLEHMIG